MLTAVQYEVADARFMTEANALASGELLTVVELSLSCTVIPVGLTVQNME